MYVKTDGKILNFCSMKCEKNLLKLERTPRYTKWTKAYEKGEGAKPEASKAPAEAPPAAPASPKPAPAPKPAQKPAQPAGQKQ